MRKAVLAVLLVGLLATGATSCGVPSGSTAATGPAVLVPADLPTSTATPVPTPSSVPTETSTPTVTLTPTSSPTSTNTPTMTPTATFTPEPSATVGPVLALADTPAYRQEVVCEVGGASVPVTIVTGKSLQAREWFGISSIGLNAAYYPDAASRLCEMVLRAHRHGWISDDPDTRGGVSFEDYRGRLAAGEDLSYEAFLFTDTGDGSPAVGAPAPVDPRAPVEFFYTEEPGPIYLAEGASFGVMRGGNGTLRLLIQLLPPVRRYFDRHYAEDAPGALAYYTSYVLNPATALQSLSLSLEFQRDGVRTAEGSAEAGRLAACGEFRDLDDLAYPCNDANLGPARFQSLMRAILSQSPVP